MEQAYLPGKIRDRIQDLMKEHKVTQATLAAKIGDEDIERPMTETARHFHLTESRAKSMEKQALDDVWLELSWW